MKMTALRLSIYMVVLLITLAAVGCATATPPASPAPARSPTSTSASPKELAIVGGPVGGTYYTLSVGFAPIIAKYTGTRASAQAGYMSEANIQLLDKKEADLIWSTANAVYPAWMGTGAFQTPQTYMRLIHSGHTGAMIFVARADAGIKTPADLKGKKLIALSPTSMSLTETWQSTLWAYGLTEKDLTMVPFTTHQAYLEAFKEKRADAALVPGAIVTAGIIELFASVPSVIVPIGTNEMAKIHEKYPYFAGAIVPAGTYKGQDKEALVHSQMVPILVHKDLPDDMAYAITKALMDHPDEVTKVHPSAQEYVNATFFNNPLAPFHPGALKYYKEKGVWTAEHQAFQDKLLGKK